MGKVGKVCIRCVLAMHRMCIDSLVFYPTISQRTYHVQHTTCSHNSAGFSIFNIHEFQAAFSTLHCTVSKCILQGKGGTVCIPCVLTFNKMRVDSRVFYPTISQRSCHVPYSTCNRNVAIHSMFIIQEFQNAYSTLHCT